MAAASLTLWADENQFQADLRREGDSFGENCIHPVGSFFSAVAGCGQLLVTGHPFHIAAGSLAPDNGVGLGIAATTHYTPNENWRLFADFDAIATPNKSWRAGGYATAVLIRHPRIVVLTGPAAAKKTHGPAISEMPAFHLYAETTSLNKLAYFGLGPSTSKYAESWYGTRETITGISAVWPVWTALKLSLVGEANGRFTQIRGNHSETNPSIEREYSEAAAPGLLHQPAYAQFGEGIVLSPSFANGRVALSYSIGFQEWVAGAGAPSFRRFNVDLGHQFPLYRNMRSLAPRQINGPDSCLQEVNAKTCPPVTRNLEGSFGLRFLYTASFSGRGAIPFYYDPTLGGSDINGNALLPSYADYRFRGPNLMLLRGSFEHSIYKWPVGVKFLVDEGRVALTRGDLGFSHLSHSYAAGLTLHAGGLPVMDLLFAWGGHEGTHTIAAVNNSLLGGAARPSLF